MITIFNNAQKLSPFGRFHRDEAIITPIGLLLVALRESLALGLFSLGKDQLGDPERVKDAGPSGSRGDTEVFNVLHIRRRRVKYLGAEMGS